MSDQNSNLSIAADSTETDDEIRDALTWLQQAGFPQYASMYQSGTMNVDPDQLALDHPFLTPPQLEVIKKRVGVLQAKLGGPSRRPSDRQVGSLLTPPSRNSGASLSMPALPRESAKERAPPVRSSSVQSVDSLNEPALETALSNHWTFEVDTRQWQRSIRGDPTSVQRANTLKWEAHRKAQSSLKRLDEFCCHQMTMVQSLSLVELTSLLESVEGSVPAKERKNRRAGLTTFLRLGKRPADDSTEYGIFGSRLEDVHLQTGYPMPLVIYNSLQYMKKEGVYLEGIFRKAGSSTRIKKLRTAFEESVSSKHPPDLSEASPHDVADVVKQFFRELPEPLMTVKFSEVYYSIARLYTSSSKFEALRFICNLLPDENREVLAILLDCLHHISRHNADSATAKGNQMTAKNLAVVFAPNLFCYKAYEGKTSDDTVKLMEAQKTMQELLELLIEKHDELFMVNESIAASATFVSIGVVDNNTPFLPIPFRSDSIKLHQETCRDMFEEAHIAAAEKAKGWALYCTRKGVKVFWNRSVTVDPIHYWRSSTVVLASPEAVLEALRDKRYTWDYHCVPQSESVVEKIDSNTDLAMYCHRGYAPAIKPRQYVVFRNWGEEKAGLWYLVSYSVQHSRAAVPETHVAGHILFSAFIIEQEGKKCKVTYIVRMDSRGRTAAWFAKVNGIIEVLKLTNLKDCFH